MYPYTKVICTGYLGKSLNNKENIYCSVHALTGKVKI